MLMLGGEWHGLRSGSTLRRRAPGTYQNLVVSSPPATGTLLPVLETGWIRFAGMQGYQRVLRATLLGDHSTGNVRVRVAYNYDDTWVDSFTWLEADIVNPMQLRSPVLSRQKIQALKFEISETADGSTTQGGGFSLEGLELEVLVKSGLSFRQISSMTGG
jgi:hypothetical protein